MRASLCPMLLLALPIAAIAQEPNIPSIRASSEIVVVDVHVSDAHGGAVHGLKQSDFSVLENGKQQNVTVAEEHAAPSDAELSKAPAPPKMEPNVYTNFTAVPESGSINILLVDSLNTPVAKQANARKQLIAFLNTLKPGTRLAVFGLTTRLSMWQGFTADPQLLVAALNNKDNPQLSPLLPDASGALDLSDDMAQFREPPAGAAIAGARQADAGRAIQKDNLRAVYTLDAINQLAHYLSGLPGRKNLIWFSGSFPLDYSTNGGRYQEKFRATMNLLARSQVAVYPVDTLGLTTTPLSDASDAKYVAEPGAAESDSEHFLDAEFADQDTMKRMAEATGGKAYTNVNDLGQAVGKVLDEGTNYYTLVYSPSNKKADGSFRKITVRVASGRYTLTYRNGYYADDAKTGPKSGPYEGDPKSKDAANTPAVRDAMHAAMQFGAPTPSELLFKAMLVASPTPSDKLPEGNTASAKSKPPYRLITVAYAANPGDVTMPQRPDGTRQVALEFVVLAYDSEGALCTQQINAVNVYAKPAAIAQFAREGIRYQQQIAVPAKGEYSLRIGIHDMIGDKVGALAVPMASIATGAEQANR